LFIFCLLSCAHAGKIIENKEQGYYLVLPEETKADKPWPILIALPGWGVKVKQDINVWAFPASKRGLFVIGIDIDYSGIRVNSDIENLYKRIKRIISSVSSTYNIDKGKIYIAGTSAGGMMSIALALYDPGAFKAIGIISGARLAFGADLNTARAREQLFNFIHGKKDKRIPISEFYNTKKKLEAGGAIIEFKVIEEGEHTLPPYYYKDLVDWFYQLSELSS
jgi:predicted esterase